MSDSADLGEWVADPHPLTEGELSYLNRVRWGAVVLFALHALAARQSDGYVDTPEMTGLILGACVMIPFTLTAEWIAGGSHGLD